MPEARHLTTFTHDLTDDQVADKERMLKEVLDNDPSLCPTIAELCVDFCVRHRLVDETEPGYAKLVRLLGHPKSSSRSVV